MDDKSNDLGNQISRKVASNLFGTVSEVQASGGHQPDAKRLAEPLEGEKSAIRFFCAGCGCYGETSLDYAQELATASGVHLPEKLEGRYLMATGCLLCDEPDKSVALKTI